MNEDEWFIVVLKCRSEDATGFLVDFYSFAEDLAEVKNLHFLVRDRVDDDVVFSFRFLTEKKNRKIAQSKISFKLKSHFPENRFIVDPDTAHPLHKFAAFPWRQTAKERGAEKFSTFCSFLGKLSRVVVDMARVSYFSSKERVEIAHIMSWMLGCTECGLISPKEIQIGYFDRIEGVNHAYLRQALAKP